MAPLAGPMGGGGTRGERRGVAVRRGAAVATEAQAVARVCRRACVRAGVRPTGGPSATGVEPGPTRGAAAKMAPLAGR
jgi:hypothetical protein